MNEQKMKEYPDLALWRAEVTRRVADRDRLQRRIDNAAAVIAESYEYGGISQSERDRFMAALNGEEVDGE